MNHPTDAESLHPAERLVADLSGSLDAVTSLIAKVEDDQWDAPTPCTDWTVRRLVSHLTGMNLVFAAMLADEAPPERPPADHVEPDPVGAFRGSSARLLAGFTAPGALDRDYSGPLGTATGSDRLQIRLYDLIAHGWDLTTAIGGSLDIPGGAAERALSFARTQVTAESRPGRFAPEMPVDPGAPAVERLVAFLGRTPSGSRT
jgi:uncharacterized protein (TIGR03086 family)